MPFLAPIIPAITGALGSVGGAVASGLGAAKAAGLLPSLIGLGGNLAGSLFGGGKSGSELSSEDALRLGIQQAQGLSRMLTPQTMSLLGKSPQGFQSALNFWTPLVGGSRTAAMETLSPEIQRINQQFNQMLQSTGGQRTGAGASIYANAPYQQQSQIQGLFSQLRPAAAESMANIGSQAGQVGTNQLYGILNALQGMGTNANQLGNMGLLQRQLSGNIAGGVGNFALEAAKGIDWGKLFGGGGGDNAFVGPPNPYSAFPSVFGGGNSDLLKKMLPGIFKMGGV